MILRCWHKGRYRHHLCFFEMATGNMIFCSLMMYYPTQSINYNDHFVTTQYTLMELLMGQDQGQGRQKVHYIIHILQQLQSLIPNTNPKIKVTMKATCFDTQQERKGVSRTFQHFFSIFSTPIEGTVLLLFSLPEFQIPCTQTQLSFKVIKLQRVILFVHQQSKSFFSYSLLH